MGIMLEIYWPVKVEDKCYSVTRDGRRTKPRQLGLHGSRRRSIHWSGASKAPAYFYGTEVAKATTAACTANPRYTTLIYHKDLPASRFCDWTVPFTHIIGAQITAGVYFWAFYTCRSH